MRSKTDGQPVQSSARHQNSQAMLWTLYAADRGPPTDFVEKFHINHVCCTLICQVTWTFHLDIWTLKLVRITARGVGTFLLIMVFLRLFIFDLWANAYHTHHVTMRP